MKNLALIFVLILVIVSSGIAQKTLSAKNYYKLGLANLEKAEIAESEESRRYFYDLANKNFSLSIVRQPTFAEAYFQRSRTYNLNDERCLQDLNKALKLNPKFDEAHTRKAEVFANYVKEDEQIREFANSYLELSNDMNEQISDNEQENKKKIERLSEILQTNSQSANIFYQRGRIYQKLGEYDKAINDYSQAIKLNPNDLSSFNNRGIACAKIGNYERAIADFVRASSIKANHHIAFYNFGLVLVNQGFFDLAINMLTASIKNEPLNIKPYQIRAIIYRKLNKVAEAEADEKMLKTLEKERL